jgi:hypothetical protein
MGGYTMSLNMLKFILEGGKFSLEKAKIAQNFIMNTILGLMEQL